MFKALEPFEMNLLVEYAQKNSILLPSEILDDWPLDKVPTSKEDLQVLIRDIELFRDGGSPPMESLSAPVTEPGKEEPWRSFPMPFGNKQGIPLADLEKKYLFGWWANFSVETMYEGKPKKPEIIERDKFLRRMLDEAGRHYEFVKKEGVKT